VKILILGSDYSWSIERIFCRVLKEMDHDVTLLPVQNYFNDFYYRNKINKIIFRLGLSNLSVNIQNRLLTEIGDTRYDLIWVFKGMEVKRDTLVKLKRNTKRLINFNPDNPFIFTDRGSGNINVTDSISVFDEHFTYDLAVKLKFENDFGINCKLVTFGFDPEKIDLIGLESLEEIIAVCFIGNPDTYRAGILLEILNKGLFLHVYGHNWSVYLNHANLTIFDPICGEEYYRTLRKYRVQLNIMRIHNLNSHNMRSIEIPGCGGVMLAPRTADHETFFEEGKSVFLYSSSDDLICQVEKIMALSSDDVNEIRLNAWKTIRDHFTYDKLALRFI